MYKNYVKVKKFSPLLLLYRWYCYIDADKYLADNLFAKYKIRVNFGKEYHKEKTAYCIIFCRIAKKDEARFLLALEELKNKMLLLGYKDYENACREIVKMLS